MYDKLVRQVESSISILCRLGVERIEFFIRELCCERNANLNIVVSGVVCMWLLLTLYKLIIRSLLSYAAPVWSNTSSYNYRRLQVSQSKCLLVIGNYPRRTPIPFLHTTLNIPPIRELIYRLTVKFFNRCPTHPNPLISSIGNYSLADLHCQYKKYIHKRPKHILL